MRGIEALMGYERMNRIAASARRALDEGFAFCESQEIGLGDYRRGLSEAIASAEALVADSRHEGSAGIMHKSTLGRNSNKGAGQSLFALAWWHEQELGR